MVWKGIERCIKQVINVHKQARFNYINRHECLYGNDLFNLIVAKLRGQEWCIEV